MKVRRKLWKYTYTGFNNFNATKKNMFVLQCISTWQETTTEGSRGKKYISAGIYL